MGYQRSYNYPGDRDNEPDPEQFHKLFIGGLSFDTNEGSLKSYFSKWGDIKDVIVMRDPNSKRSRGFGFIKYKSKSSIDDVQKDRPHKVDDREVETKRAMPRDDPSNLQQSVKKMFVGGMKEDTTEDQVKNAFGDYGNIELVELITDKATGKGKGFGFVTFDDYDPVDKLVLLRRVMLNGKNVEMKKAFAKGEMNGQGNRQMQMNMGMQMGRQGRGDFGFGGPGGFPNNGGFGYGPNQYSGGYGPGGWNGGYNDFNYNNGYQGNGYQGNNRYGGNNYNQGNYGGGFNRR